MDELNDSFKLALADMMDNAVDSLLEIIKFDKSIEYTFTKSLDKEQAEEIIRWFNDDVIPLYNELGLKEKADNAEMIKKTIERYNENFC